MKSTLAFFVLLLLLAGTPVQASDFNIVVGYSKQDRTRCETHGSRHQKGDCHGKKKTVYFEKEFLPYFLSRVFFHRPYHYYYTRSGHSYYPCSQYYCKKHHRYHTYDHKHNKHSKKKHCNDRGGSNYGQHKKHSYRK